MSGSRTYITDPSVSRSHTGTSVLSPGGCRLPRAPWAAQLSPSLRPSDVVCVCFLRARSGLLDKPEHPLEAEQLEIEPDKPSDLLAKSQGEYKMITEISGSDVRALRLRRSKR